MTDEQIIKALECCKDRECQTGCPRLHNNLPIEDDCRCNLIKDALDLINRQQAEIERLKGWENLLKAEKHSLIKTEAIKEFAERLKSLVNQHHYMLANIHNSRDFGMFTVGFEQAIDNIVKEMVGDKE